MDNFAQRNNRSIPATVARTRNSAADRRQRKMRQGSMQPTIRPSEPEPVRKSYTKKTPVIVPAANSGTTAVQATFGAQKQRRSLPWKMIGAVFASLLVIGLAVFAGTVIFKKPPPPPAVPKQIKAAASYNLFYPTDTKVISVDKSSVKYNKEGGLLSFVSMLPSGNKIIFSEQNTPDSFSDVHSTYDLLVQSLQPYSSFETANGKVTLTHPKELKGVQTAVMNTKGTLLFARATQDISDDDWRRIFNNLDINH